MNKKIMVILGTRPEVIKLYPVVKQLKKKGFRVQVVSTGQHKHLVKQIADDLKFKIDLHLKVMQKDQSLTNLTARLHRLIAVVLKKHKPDLVIVQGDTTSALVGALEAFYHHIPVAHVEAGLRSGNIYNPFPEEVNRRTIDDIATYRFAPTEKNASNIFHLGGAYVTGQTSIDTLLEFAGDLEEQILTGEKGILITLHRRETFGVKLQGILEAIKVLAKDNPAYLFVFPVHLNPNVKQEVHRILGDIDNVRLYPPVGYLTMITLMKWCSFIMTDSGGIQEEAPSLNKPVLVLRDETERLEGQEAEVSKLLSTDPKKIIKEATRLMTSPKYYDHQTRWINPYGDGHASERIAKYLWQKLR